MALVAALIAAGASIWAVDRMAIRSSRQTVVSSPNDSPPPVSARAASPIEAAAVEPGERPQPERPEWSRPASAIGASSEPQPARIPASVTLQTSTRRDHRTTASIEARPPAPVSAASSPTDRARSTVQLEALTSFNRGSQAMAAGNWEEAGKVFQELVDGNPRLVEGWNNLGLALLRQGKVSSARAAFDRALSLDPEYPAGLQNLGFLLMVKEGKPVEAAELFQRAAAAAPRMVAPRVNLAVALVRTGRLAEAQRILLEARKEFPRDPDLLYHLGTVSERTGDRERAVEAYHAFLEAARGARLEQEQLVREHLDAWGKRF